MMRRYEEPKPGLELHSEDNRVELRRQPEEGGRMQELPQHCAVCGFIYGPEYHALRCPRCGSRATVPTPWRDAGGRWHYEQQAWTVRPPRQTGADAYAAAREANRAAQARAEALMRAGWTRQEIADTAYRPAPPAVGGPIDYDDPGERWGRVADDTPPFWCLGGAVNYWNQHGHAWLGVTLNDTERRHFLAIVARRQRADNGDRQAAGRFQQRYYAEAGYRYEGATYQPGSHIPPWPGREGEAVEGHTNDWLGVVVDALATLQVGDETRAALAEAVAANTCEDYEDDDPDGWDEDDDPDYF